MKTITNIKIQGVIQNILTNMSYVFLGVSCLWVHARLSETLKYFAIWAPSKQLLQLHLELK